MKYFFYLWSQLFQFLRKYLIYHTLEAGKFNTAQASLCFLRLGNQGIQFSVSYPRSFRTQMDSIPAQI